MKKILSTIPILFVLIFFPLNNSVSAEEYTQNQIKAFDILVNQGYSIQEASADLQHLPIETEGELIGIDIFSNSKENDIVIFRTSAVPTTTQYLSHSAVRQIYSNFNAIDKGSYILGTLIGFKNPIIGAIIGAGGFQNPNFRDAITKAYHQGKRVKIVTEYGASMSLNRTYYYVVN